MRYQTGEEIRLGDVVAWAGVECEVVDLQEPEGDARTGAPGFVCVAREASASRLTTAAGWVTSRLVFLRRAPKPTGDGSADAPV